MDVHVGRNEAEVGTNTPRHFSFHPQADFARGGGMGVLL